MRETWAWGLLGEGSANVKDSYHGVSENGKEALNVTVSDYPPLDRIEQPLEKTDKEQPKNPKKSIHDRLKAKPEQEEKAVQPKIRKKEQNL